MDEHDLRSQMAANKRRTGNGQILFYGALLAIPVLGLIGGMAMKGKTGAVAAPVVTVKTEPAAMEQDAFSQMDVGMQYLTLLAQDDKILAGSVYLADDYPDLLKENAFRAVLSEIARCARTYPKDTSLAGMQEHYRSTNINNYMMIANRLKNDSRASDALMVLLAEGHQREVMNIALNPVAKLRFLKEVKAFEEDMANIEETVSKTQMSHAECVATKKLVGKGSLNLNRL